MTVWSYRAADAAGRTIDGQMEAYDPQAVVERLHREQYFPLRIDRVDGAPGMGRLRGLLRGRVPPGDLLIFTRELTTLVEAGLPLERALTIAAELAPSARLREVAEDVARAVRGGASLGDALAGHQPRPFSRLYVSTVRAGERGGVLETALRRLAEHLEAMRELRQAVTSALLYPAMLLVVGGGAVVFLLAFVLPRFAVVFADLGQALPLSTRVLLAVSQALAAYWWVGPLLALGAALAWQVGTRSEEGRLAVDRWLLAVPLLGPLLTRIEVGRMTRTLATSLAAGVPLLGALGVAREVCGNRVIGAALDAVQDGVKRGDGLAGPMGASGRFPPLAVHLVRVGEETGRLEEMLGRVATILEGEIRVVVRRLVTLLEPAIIVVLGLIVMAIVVAIFLAIVSINELPL